MVTYVTLMTLMTFTPRPKWIFLIFLKTFHVPGDWYSNLNFNWNRILTSDWLMCLKFMYQYYTYDIVLWLHFWANNFINASLKMRFYLEHLHILSFKICVTLNMHILCLYTISRVLTIAKFLVCKLIESEFIEKHFFKRIMDTFLIPLRIGLIG